jgi:hypothetical protein
MAAIHLPHSSLRELRGGKVYKVKISTLQQTKNAPRGENSPRGVFTTPIQ